MTTILVTGANGQLGNELRSISGNYNFKFLFTTRNELDITNSDIVTKYFDKNKISIVINTAAYTAVDKAESDLENAYNANALAVKYLSDACKLHSAKLIHISTDFVFDGSSSIPYTEDMDTNPLNTYGKTKLDGEFFALESDAIIIRTSWVYSSFGNNFVKTMLRLSETRPELSVLFDQIGTPTYAADLAKAIMHICIDKENINKKGVYHFSNEGVASWYDFALAVFEFKNVECKVKPILTEQYPTPAKRPHFSVLNKNKFKTDFNFEINHWRESLKLCVQSL